MARRQAARRFVVPGALAIGAVLAGAWPGSAITFTVTNTNDAGPGSLRQAITDANAAPTFDIIVFAIPSGSVISLQTALPQITGSSPLAINGLGPSNLTIRRDPAAAAAFRIFDIGATPLQVHITGVTLTGGNPATFGGGAINAVGSGVPGVQTVFIQDSVITGNSATGTSDGGGGIRIGGSTGLTIQRTVISGNTSVDGGGGIYLAGGNPVILEDSTISGNSGSGADSEGGGLYADFGNNLTIRGTTISGNTAPGTTGEGGGIFIRNGANTMTIENSTISGNTAGLRGGGLLSAATGPLTITHSTITLNTASGAAGSGGGGIFLATGFTGATLRHTIVSGNTNVNTPDISAGTINVNFSAIGNATGWTPSGTSGNNLPPGTNLQLGPLQNSGGPTMTHEPGPNAPPVNAGDPAFTPPPATDQRGFARVVGGVIDIGSVERDPVPVEVQEFTVE